MTSVVCAKRHISPAKLVHRIVRPNFRYQSILNGFGLTIPLGLALWLRWQYVIGAGLHVDEFATLLASRRTMEMDAPIMPSGVFYTRGILST